MNAGKAIKKPMRKPTDVGSSEVRLAGGLWSRKRIVILGLLAASGLIIATSVVLVVHAQQPQSSTYTISVGGSSNITNRQYNGYTPSTLAIRAGDTIVWKNIGSDVIPHTVTSSDTGANGAPVFDSSPKFNLTPQLVAVFFGPGGFLPPGGTFVLDTSQLHPGTYKYQCTLHDALGMVGAVTVTSDVALPGAAERVVAGWNGYGSEVTLFSPSSLTVARGTQVVFQSLAGVEPHTVVSETQLSNGTVVLGSNFDSSPKLVPPGITEVALSEAPPPFPVGPGGVLLPLPNLDRYNFTFNTPGTYQYYCKLHSVVVGGVRAGMVGEVIVLSASASAQELSTVQSSVSGAQSELGSLTNQVSTSTTLAYAAIAIAIILGLVAIGNSARMRRKA